MSSQTSAEVCRELGFEFLWQDADRIFCKGWDEDDSSGKKSILAVLPAASNPPPDYLNRLAHEYLLKDSLAAGWAVRPLDYVRELSILLLEDQGGEPLAGRLGAPMELDRFLRLALALSSAVAGMHASGLIHKDIKPGNVLVNPSTDQVWLTGFGIASRVPPERQSPAPPEVIVGTFAYMAPEQTGRMNRSIDLRSDLYSLGVTLYEMLTGALPFAASEPMQWIHCHIARQPAPPIERVATIPEAVSAIILKLLAKAAEDRYQTAAGLHHDLHRCLTQWRARQCIEPFTLGANDVPSQLLFREKLYGRETEIGRLIAAFERVVAEGRSELVLVSGYSGIGKSSVVNELQRALVRPGGLFAVGKFDQYKRGIPYATLAQAFQGLVRQLLCKSDTELARWRSALAEALGLNGQLMINLVPELALIIGEQPPVADLSGPEAQGRFLVAIRQFIKVFARKEHPLVLFLDDLQWLDQATLDVFAHLASQPESRHLLLVGAYRDNEVGPAHPLTGRLKAVRESGRPLQEIVLGGIRFDDVARMLTEALAANPDDVEPLARAIAEKTGCNPFFAIQFAGALAEEELLTYDATASAWRWDIERIRAKRVSDNVVDLMIERLGRLPDASLQALKIAACMGSSVEIAKLHLVLETTGLETQDLLREPLRIGLLLQVDANYAFAHDRVQEAAYAMLPISERADTHRRIGSRLMAAMDQAEVEAQIFEIVSQLNRAEIAHGDVAGRALAASLNLRAGLRAKASSAYGAARGYLAQGRAQLGEDGWTSNYALAFALALEHAECTFFDGELDEALGMTAPLLSRAATNIDRATVYRLKVELHVVRSDNVAATECGLAALQLFGIAFPDHPDRAEIEREYNDIWTNLNGRSIECLAELPPMTDPEQLVIMRVLAEMWPPSFFTDFNLTTLVVCRMVNCSLLHGTANSSTQGYALLGWIMGPALGRYEEGYPIASLACRLAKKRNVPLDMARVYTTMGLTSAWTQPLATSIEWFREANRIGLEAGDAYFACFSSAFVAMTLFQRGRNLHLETKETSEYLRFALGTGFRDGAEMSMVPERASACLRGLTRGLADFSDDQFDQAEFEAALTGARAPVVGWWYWTRKVMLHFLSGDYQAALDAAGKVLTGRCQIVQIQHLDYHYYTALALAARIGEVPVGRREELRRRLEAHYDQIQTWAHETRSATFSDKCALVAAEIARIEGRDLEAERLYEDSIRLAHENGFLQNEAIANEVASRFYAARGFDKIARVYLRDARDCYHRWGADAKVRQLDELHPHPGHFELAPAPTNTTVASVEQLDLATVIKVSQAISSEIVLEKLIDTLMRTAIEHAGAERAVLLLSRGAEHRVEAEATTRGDMVMINLRKGPISATALPEAILLYVARTLESVILDDASAGSPFSGDAYIRQNRARSLLCQPLTNQGKLIGLLYLENNLAPRVFTPGRQAVLKLIASQAAISLENTRLYRDLAERESRIRRLVDSNVIGIVIWDLDGRLIDTNDAFLRMVQHDREDLRAGLAWFDMTPPEWQERVPQEVEELRTTGIMQPCEKEFFRKDGSRVRVLIGAAAFEGEPTQGVAYILDLTERQRAEQEARESERRYRELQAELAHANRVATMGQLSAWIAHDVKQPLVGVVSSGNAGIHWLAAEPPNIKAARRALERIVRDGHRAADILDRTRSMVKKATPKTETVDLNQVISETLALIEAEAGRNGITVRVDLARTAPLVSADRIQIQQVVMNLMVNAIEAMIGDTTPRRDLLVTSAIDAWGSAVTAIHDSGPGLPQEHRDRVFDAFFTTKPNGLGIGLAICRTIIESYGGKIWITPNIPRGTVVHFALPAGGGDHA